VVYDAIARLLAASYPDLLPMSHGETRMRGGCRSDPGFENFGLQAHRPRAVYVDLRDSDAPCCLPSGGPDRGRNQRLTPSASKAPHTRALSHAPRLPLSQLRGRDGCRSAAGDLWGMSGSGALCRWTPGASEACFHPGPHTTSASVRWKAESWQHSVSQPLGRSAGPLVGGNMQPRRLPAVLLRPVERIHIASASSMS
jgi:hypothetical protein